MVWLLLEALLALVLLLGIVWWTMFSGRMRGERTPHDSERGEARSPPEDRRA